MISNGMVLNFRRWSHLLLQLCGVFVSFTMVPPEFSFAGECAELFSAPSTDRLISYLTELLENNAIGERELVTLREGLDRGELLNPIPHKGTTYGPVFDTSARQIQFRVVQRHLGNRPIDPVQLRTWVERNLEEKFKIRKSREEVRIETQDIFRKMEFHLLPPGEFEMGKVGRQVPVTLTHSIEMMSSPITQKMWVDVMGENPSHFKNGPESVEIEIDGKMVRMQPDHPVEFVTWWSVVVFANRLSEQRGLKPAYDLSEVETKGRAEDGTLEVVKGDFKITAPEGDIYQAEGFRLPTEAEQEYVLRNLGRAKGEYPFDLTEADLADYGWFSMNSEATTHAVGSTPKSLSIDGKTFDDLIGNVMKWSHDHLPSFTGGINPVGRINGDRDVRCNGWGNGGEFLSSAYRLTVSPGVRYPSLGARLVRTVDSSPMGSR